MDDDYGEEEPPKRNLRNIILVATVVVLVALAAVYSAQSRISDQSQSLHISLSEINLVGGRLSAIITNDGIMELDVESVQINEGSVMCFSLPKNIAPGDSQRLRCTASGVKAGTSYMLIVTVQDVDGESNYRTSTYVIARP